MALPPLLRAKRYQRRDMTRSPVFASDSFNRADGAVGDLDGLLGGGAGKSWTVASGTWAIASNVLSCSSAGNLTVDLGVTSCRVRVQRLAISGTLSILGRYVDANNHWRVLLDGGRIEIFEITGGGATSRGSSLMTTNSGDYWEALFTPGYIGAYFPRTGAIVGFASTAHAAGTSYGMRSSGAPSTFDNFLVTAAA
jgi:hypothetical protein